MGHMRNIFIGVVVLAIFVGAGLLYVMKHPPVVPKAATEAVPVAAPPVEPVPPLAPPAQ